MHELTVSDAEIEAVERLLLPTGCSFDKEARAVIRRWESADIVACPGSGKTTVLLAKLKLLADRMPLENGAGVCVLSHTNAAVDEIGLRFPSCASRLLGYPNFVGTIQSFVDKFLVMPYIRWRHGVVVRPVDDETYGKALAGVMYKNGLHALAGLAKRHVNSPNSPYRDVAGFVGGLRIDGSGALLCGNGKSVAGPGAPSTMQFEEAVEDLLRGDGVIRYGDAYRYALRAIDEMPGDYASLVSARFAYVFVDEYQDCSQVQRDVLDAVFDAGKCCVMHMGDPDQAIYSSDKDKTEDWMAGQDCLTLSRSNRFGQRVADVLSPLRLDKERIVSSFDGDGARPTLIVYDEHSITSVPACFAREIEACGLDAERGIFKAIGYVGSPDTKGTSIGDYWDGYQKTNKSRYRSGYWDMAAELSASLSSGEIYCAEPTLRKLLAWTLRHAGYREKEDGTELTASSIRGLLGDRYCARVLALAESVDKGLNSVDAAVRELVASIIGESAAAEAFSRLPAYFTMRDAGTPENNGANNVYIDPTLGTKIQFDTVHGVKGETHDATLYLETDKSRGSDIGRVLHLYGVRKRGATSALHEYSRKIVYVGMSRPRKLLCVAVKSKTYEDGKEAFRDWKVVDLRGDSVL